MSRLGTKNMRIQKIKQRLLYIIASVFIIIGFFTLFLGILKADLALNRIGSKYMPVVYFIGSAIILIRGFAFLFNALDMNKKQKIGE